MGVLSLRGKPRWAAAGSSALLVTLVLLVSSLASAAPANAAVGGDHGRPLPYRIFAPYFETYDLRAGGLADQSQASGAKFLSLAFLQTDQGGSCVADWNGDPTQPISQALRQRHRRHPGSRRQRHSVVRWVCG